MFVRVKRNGSHDYLQLVESGRIDGKVRQRVIGTLGRRDLLEGSAALGGLLASLGKFTRHAAVLSEHRCGNTQVLWTRSLGPGLVFGRLWQQLGVPQVLQELLADRKFGFAVERAVFLTVLHRLMGSGGGGRSDRAAEKWREDQLIPGAEELELQHLYRAMAWLGEELDWARQSGATPFSPRCTKDRIEEALFQRRRDLFTGLSLAFFDTTSLYFEGEGGESIGQHGHSRDHRPDLKQMVVGMVLDGAQDGRDRRFVVCHNPEQARKDRADREAMVAGLRDQLRHGVKSLVGNKGYRKYVQVEGQAAFGIDWQKVKAEERFDGKWVLRSNWDSASVEELALRYKDLWRVEAVFRAAKTTLQTRPIYHKCDATIRGHVFCSFLALVLIKELEDRLSARGWDLEWADVLRELEALRVTRLLSGAATCELRSAAGGVAGKVLAATGVAPGPTLRFIREHEEEGL